MPGTLGIFGSITNKIDKTFLVETIDLLGISKNHIFSMGDNIFAVSYLKNESQRGTQFFEDPSFTACLCGELIDPSPVPWDKIINSCRSPNNDIFEKMRGCFVLVVYDTPNQRLHIVSDRISQYPIFYTVNGANIVFSTAMSTFTRLPDPPVFSIDWLYEFLFFNFPIGTTTFLKNVKRMPPASILCYDLKTSTTSLYQYASPFQKEKNPLYGEKALKTALEIFTQRVPRYFDDNGQKTFQSISGGFDSRVLLALALRPANLETYTYGVPSCHDLTDASKLTRTLKLAHKEILFDQAFFNQLPSLISRTVMLSNGLQHVNRSTLLYVYSNLTNNGKDPAIFISGVSGDQLFRGHGNVPAMVSFDTESIFRTGKFIIRRPFYEGIFCDSFNNFDRHIQDVVTDLEDRYGHLDHSEAHLSYLIYEVATKGFAGEAAIANTFGIFRAPYWDTEIVNLAYEIEYSTIYFSTFLPGKKDTRRENILASYLIGSNPSFAGIPLQGLPMSTYSRDNLLLYQFHRAIKLGPIKVWNSLFPRYIPPLEDWQQWYKHFIYSEIDSLLNRNSMITNYVDISFLEKVKESSDIHWLGKIVTVELLLNLINTRWKM